MTCPRPHSRAGPARWAPSATPKNGVHGRLQIVYGLLTSKDGIPVAIEVFKGNTGDPTTVAAQVTKVKDRFGIDRVVLVGDRGMLTAARLREDVAAAHLDWITALRAPQVKALVRGGDLQLTLFDVQDLAEMSSRTSPASGWWPARTRTWKRAGAQTRKPAGRHRGRPGENRRGLRADPAAAARHRHDRRARRPGPTRRKVARHFTTDITDDSLRYARDQDSIAAEAKLDGIYVLGASVAATDLDSGAVVSSYKALARSSARLLKASRPVDPVLAEPTTPGFRLGRGGSLTFWLPATLSCESYPL